MGRKITVEDLASRYNLQPQMSGSTKEFVGRNPWDTSKSYAQTDGFALTASGPYRGSAYDRKAKKQYTSREVAANSDIEYEDYAPSQDDPTFKPGEGSALLPALEKQFDTRSLEERGLNDDARKFFKITGPEGMETKWGERRLWPTYHPDGTTGRRRRKYRYPALQLQSHPDKTPRKTDWEKQNLDWGMPVAYGINWVRPGHTVWIVNSELGVWLFWQEGLTAIAPLSENRREENVRTIVKALSDKGALEIRILLDNDKAGRDGAVKFFNVCNALKVPVFVYDLTSAPKVGYDACDLWEFWRDGSNDGRIEKMEFEEFLLSQKLCSRTTLSQWVHASAEVEAKAAIEKTEKSLNELGQVMEKGKPAKEEDDAAKTATSAKQMLEMLRLNQFFHTAEGNRCVVVDRGGGMKTTYEIESGEFAEWVRFQWFIQTNSVAKPALIQQTLQTLAALARWEGPKLKSHIRTANFAGKYYVDLCNEAGEVVEISESGWEIVASCPVFFRRPRGMEELPRPERPKEGDNADTWEQFKSLINYGDERNWILIVAWMVSALVPDRWPCPILNIFGEAGSAKSWLTRLVRQSVDPNEGFMVQTVREERDVVVVAEQMRVFALDNQEKIESWLSNLLCSMVTGTPYACRTLYKDDEHKVFRAQPAMIVNGIPEKLGGTDLADRMIKLFIPKIVDKGYKREALVLEEWEPLRPAILAAIFDAMVTGLKNKRNADSIVDGRKMPRMADFATWVMCCEDALPFDKGAFYKAYTTNIVEAAGAELDDIFAVVFMEFVAANNGQWYGFAGKLHTELEMQALEHLINKESNGGEFAGHDEARAARAVAESKARDALKRLKNWPSDSAALSRRLANLSGALLKSANIQVEHLKRQAGGVPYRITTLEPKTQELVDKVIQNMEPSLPLTDFDGPDPFEDEQDEPLYPD